MSVIRVATNKILAEIIANKWMQLGWQKVETIRFDKRKGRQDSCVLVIVAHAHTYHCALTLHISHRYFDIGWLGGSQQNRKRMAVEMVYFG